MRTNSSSSEVTASAASKNGTSSVVPRSLRATLSIPLTTRSPINCSSEPFSKVPATTSANNSLSRCLLASRSLLNSPQRTSVSGIGFASLQPPAVYWKKSLQACTLVSKCSSGNAGRASAISDSGAAHEASAPRDRSTKYFLIIQG